MDIVTALNVTIYGLGIVFLALLVVMFVIMVLSRLFAAATGNDFLVAAEAGEDKSETVSQPVKAINASAPAPSSAPVVRPVPSSASAPAPVPSTLAPKLVVGGGKVTAPLPGKIISIAVKAGDIVHKGNELCVIEAMKMSNSLKSQRDCSIKDVLVSVGDSVPFGTVLFVIE